MKTIAEHPQSADLCQRVRIAPDGANLRSWTLRADNQNHHHGTVRLSESPLYLALSWRATGESPVQSVGVFRLDLHALLAGGYVRVEAMEGDETVRLRLVRSEDGAFWIQSRGDTPALRIPDSRGSLRWIREAVNTEPERLNGAIRSAIGLSSGEDITWRSPLAADGFREYRDLEALRQMHAPPLRRALNDFWPEGGPVWDGLATTSGGALLFVEAKAHVRELISPPSKATPDSRKLIENALLEAREFLAPDSRTDWSRMFYQYANRLAYLYFLRQQNDVNAHLIFVNFLGATDVQGPTSPQAWTAAYAILHAALGLPERHPLSSFVHHVTIELTTRRLESTGP